MSGGNLGGEMTVCRRLENFRNSSSDFPFPCLSYKYVRSSSFGESSSWKTSDDVFYVGVRFHYQLVKFHGKNKS